MKKLHQVYRKALKINKKHSQNKYTTFIGNKIYKPINIKTITYKILIMKNLMLFLKYYKMSYSQRVSLTKKSMKCCCDKTLQLLSAYVTKLVFLELFVIKSPSYDNSSTSRYITILSL